MAGKGLREALGGTGGGYAGDAVVGDAPRDRSNFIGDHRAGSWGHWALLECGKIGVVLRDGAAGAFQRRAHALWADAAGSESLFEMGFCGSGEFGSGELSALPGPPCEPVVCAVAGSQRAQQGGGGGGPAFGGSGVSCAAPPASLSRSGP